jgi:hypothetical protein
LMSLVFFGEACLFFSAAIHNAGRDQVTAVRFLVLTLGVFATASAALAGFGRRIRAAGAAFVGLLVVQPALDALLPARRGAERAGIATALVCCAIAACLFIFVVRSNRTGGD